jgi:hypothetical protein
MRFYMGTFWMFRRADLTIVYAMICRRQPQRIRCRRRQSLEPQKRRAKVEQFLAELRGECARARDEAMDRPPRATVRAYRHVYGCDPCGWPPA